MSTLISLINRFIDTLSAKPTTFSAAVLDDFAKFQRFILIRTFTVYREHYSKANDIKILDFIIKKINDDSKITAAATSVETFSDVPTLAKNLIRIMDPFNPTYERTDIIGHDLDTMYLVTLSKLCIIYAGMVSGGYSEDIKNTFSNSMSELTKALVGEKIISASQPFGKDIHVYLEFITLLYTTNPEYIPNVFIIALQFNNSKAFRKLSVYYLSDGRVFIEKPKKVMKNAPVSQPTPAESIAEITKEINTITATLNSTSITNAKNICNGCKKEFTEATLKKNNGVCGRCANKL